VCVSKEEHDRERKFVCVTEIWREESECVRVSILMCDMERARERR
jgi:hypothetical protein